jgi:hypothetical protein
MDWTRIHYPFGGRSAPVGGRIQRKNTSIYSASFFFSQPLYIQVILYAAFLAIVSSYMIYIH